MINTEASTKQILIVEDEPSICEVCIKALSGKGYKIDIATNGSLGEKKLNEKDYDLVIIDMRTPVMNGKELYNSIIKNHYHIKDKVIFTTGGIIGGDTPVFLKKSGRPFLPKPFTPNELRETVKQYFNEEAKTDDI